MSNLLSFLKAADPRNWKKLENQEQYNIVPLKMDYCVVKHDTSINSGYTYTYALPNVLFHGNSHIASVHGITEHGRRIVPMQLSLIGYNTVMVTTARPIRNDLKLLCMLVTPKLVVEPEPTPLTVVPTPAEVVASISKLPMQVVRVLNAFRVQLGCDEFVRSSLIVSNELVLHTRENLSDTYIGLVEKELQKCGWVAKVGSYNVANAAQSFILSLPDDV